MTSPTSEQIQFVEIQAMLSSASPECRNKGAALAYQKYLPYLMGRYGLDKRGRFANQSPILPSGETLTDICSNVYLRLKRAADRSPMHFVDRPGKEGNVILGENQLKSYLNTICENLIRDSKSRRKHLQEGIEDWEQVLDDCPTPSVLISEKERLRRIDQLFAKVCELMTSDERETFQWIYREKLTWLQVAERRLTVKNVNQSIEAAIQKEADRLRIEFRRRMDTIRGSIDPPSFLA